jgi:hypothetical protein
MFVNKTTGKHPALRLIGMPVVPRVEEPAETHAPTELEKLQTFLGSITKGSNLQLAERAVTALRRERADLAEAQMAERLELARRDQRDPLSNYRRPQQLDREMAEMDRRLVVLREARASWRPTLERAVQPARAEAAATILAAINGFRHAAELLAAIDHHAARNGFELPNSFSPPVLDHIERAAKRLINGA